jgi:hypothetical protein
VGPGILLPVRGFAVRAVCDHLFAVCDGLTGGGIHVHDVDLLEGKALGLEDKKTATQTSAIARVAYMARGTRLHLRDTEVGEQ